METAHSRMVRSTRCRVGRGRMHRKRYEHAARWNLVTGLVVMVLAASSKEITFANSTTNSTECDVPTSCGENGQVHPFNPCECECDEGWVTNMRQDVLSPNMQWCDVRKELQDANNDREHSSSGNATSNNTHIPRPSSASQTSLIETALHPGKQCSCQVSDEKRVSYLLTKKSESPSFHTSLGGDRLHCVLHCCLLQLR